MAQKMDGRRVQPVGNFEAVEFPGQRHREKA
jgi:hypothetical protein